jgi:hypothetical protein
MPGSFDAAMHLAPSIFGSNIHPLLEKAFPETASIGLIGIMHLLELKD